MTRDQFIEISKWQDETFGQATALSKMYHLAEEVIELMNALKPLNPVYKDIQTDFGEDYAGQELDKEENKKLNNLCEAEIRKEFADCFLLLFGAAASHGYTFEEITGLIAEKHRINRARKWGKPDANGVVRHVKVDVNNNSEEEIRGINEFLTGGKKIVVIQHEGGLVDIEGLQKSLNEAILRSPKDEIIYLGPGEMVPWDAGMKAERLERKIPEVPKEERTGPTTT